MRMIPLSSIVDLDHAFSIESLPAVEYSKSHLFENDSTSSSTSATKWVHLTAMSLASAVCRGQQTLWAAETADSLEQSYQGKWREATKDVRKQTKWNNKGAK